MGNALIALGGNLGDVRATFARAIPEVCRTAQAKLVARSSDYLTPPWGEQDQPAFVNACIAVETDLDPLALLSVLLDVEQRFGRTRSTERRWGPRPLDLDLIAYDDVAVQSAVLTLPHPRLFERAFVLVPLAEIVPERAIAGRTVRAALAELPTEGIERLPGTGTPSVDVQSGDQ
jgi:2-amino-4-hydroxy-6-hydroxymethyldihydropteridine diphosphokinase